MLEIMTNEAESSAKIIVIGVGGAGNNAVNRMVEEAIGGVSRISVVVPVDGKLRLAVGGTFSYYEFTVPIDSRMTDSEWRQMIGMELNDDMEYEYDNKVEQPSWTKSYRYSWDG